MIEELTEDTLPVYKDKRGKVNHFGQFSVEGLHIATMLPSAIRGNHIHDKDEIICVIGGSGICEIVAEDEISGERENIVVEEDMKTYRIKAGVKHIVRNTGSDAFYLVCFYI